MVDRSLGGSKAAGVDRNASNSSFFNHVYLDGSARGAERGVGAGAGGPSGTKPLRVRKKHERAAPIGPPRMRRRQSALSLPRSPRSPLSAIYPSALSAGVGAGAGAGARGPSLPSSPIRTSAGQALTRGDSTSTTSSTAHRAISSYFLAIDSPLALTSAPLPQRVSACEGHGIGLSSAHAVDGRRAEGSRMPGTASEIDVEMESATLGDFTNTVVPGPSPPSSPPTSPPHPTLTVLSLHAGGAIDPPEGTSSSTASSISPGPSSADKPLPPSPTTPLTPSRAPSKAAQILGTRPAPPLRVALSPSGAGELGRRLGLAVGAGMGRGRAMMATAVAGIKASTAAAPAPVPSVERSAGKSKLVGKRREGQFRPLPHSSLDEINRFFGDVPRPLKPKASIKPSSSSHSANRGGSTAISAALSGHAHPFARPSLSPSLARAAPAHQGWDGRMWLDVEEEQEFAWLMSDLIVDLAPEQRAKLGSAAGVAHATGVHGRQIGKVGKKSAESLVEIAHHGDTRGERAMDSFQSVLDLKRGYAAYRAKAEAGKGEEVEVEVELDEGHAVGESFLNFVATPSPSALLAELDLFPSPPAPAWRAITPPRPARSLDRPMSILSTSPTPTTRRISTSAPTPHRATSSLSTPPRPPLMTLLRTPSPPSRPRHRPPPLDLTALPRVRGLPIAVVTSPSPPLSVEQRAIPDGPSSPVEPGCLVPAVKAIPPRVHRPLLGRREVSDPLPIPPTGPALAQRQAQAQVQVQQPRTPFKHPRAAPRVPAARPNMPAPPPPGPPPTIPLPALPVLPTLTLPLPLPGQAVRSTSTSAIPASRPPLDTAPPAAPSNAAEDDPLVFIPYASPDRRPVPDGKNANAAAVAKAVIKEYGRPSLDQWTDEEEDEMVDISVFEPVTPVLAVSGFHASLAALGGTNGAVRGAAVGRKMSMGSKTGSPAWLKKVVRL